MVLWRTVLYVGRSYGDDADTPDGTRELDLRSNRRTNCQHRYIHTNDHLYADYYKSYSYNSHPVQ